MQLFITIEAQNATDNGLFEIFRDINQQLSFVTDNDSDLEIINNYGNEFRIISVIPSCVDDDFWKASGWKERKQIWRKKKEADIRLRIDYNRFIEETLENRRLMFNDIIVKSIQVIQEKSIGDFQGVKLIEDILEALNITKSQLSTLEQAK